LLTVKYSYFSSLFWFLPQPNTTFEKLVSIKGRNGNRPGLSDTAGFTPSWLRMETRSGMNPGLPSEEFHVRDFNQLT
jgi:hypothetical protein